LIGPDALLGLLKADPPLVIDIDAALALPALQSFQPVAEQGSAIFQSSLPRTRKN
jgi:hypothetical protein